MDKIFFHFGEDSIANRDAEIKEFISNSFIPDHIQVKKAEIFYLDAHLEPKEYLYDPLVRRNLEANLLIETFSELAEYCEEIKILMITKQDLKELRKVTGSEERIISFPHTEYEKCLFKIGEYSSVPKNRYPSELHDRWLLIKIEGLYVTGLHLGGSLNSYSATRDITITHFDHSGCKQALKRFEELWSYCERAK